MMIHANTAMRRVTVDGITVTCNSDDAKEFKAKFPNAVVKRMYPRKKKGSVMRSGPCLPVPVEHYLNQTKGVN